MENAKSCVLELRQMEMRLDMNDFGFNYFDLPSNEADELHTHDHFQLSIPINNPIQVYFNDQWRVIRPGEGLLVAPGDFHQHEAAGARAEILLVGVTESLLKLVIEDQLETPVDSIDFSPWQKGEMAPFFQKAKQAFQTVTFEGMENGKDLMWDVTSMFLHSLSGSHSHLMGQKISSDSPVVRRAIDFIKEHYRESLSLDILAANLNMSKYHLHRSFKQATGRTPTEYIHEVRVKAAAQLIQLNHLDITTAAFQVGYGSLNTFRRSFQKHFGQNPLAFKKTRS